MSLALDAIKAVSIRRFLIATGETTMAGPGSILEPAYGGVAALVLGDEGIIASIEGSHHISDEFAGTWRYGAYFWKTRPVR